MGSGRAYRLPAQRRRIAVRGTVQGVGFRPFVYAHAQRLGLAGWVRNDSSGVLIEVEGDPGALDRLVALLCDAPPPLARVEGCAVVTVAPTGERGFTIVASDATGGPDVAVSADVATCADCLRELFDPADRRYRYPFVNCTNCGPRYTIVRAVPYDRANTTMDSFAMCPQCRAEYEDPADRRFHAEPTACPGCGPQLIWSEAGEPIRRRGDEAFAAVAAVLGGGGIVALKGLGGYHLATDAGDEAAVGELRRRKSRDDKPFAVMVPDIAAAAALCHLDGYAVAALSGPARPIVLAPRRRGAPVAAGVAPGLGELGLMLPYTPLHHLIMETLGRPLVMTSGNLSDEPIAHEDLDAADRLGPLVDGICSSDRAIHIRCDDSVVRAAGGMPTVLRRSRGYAPAPLRLPGPARRPVLAVGAMLKNTVAVARDGIVVASHHIGDLEQLATYRSFGQAVGHLCRLYGVRPELVAHDLHPEYLSTKYAQELDWPLCPVQHHHAHVAACLVDHGRSGPVLGLAFDGHGYGTDRTLWGGEFLVADLSGFERVAHLRPVPLAGGATAVREPWRMAVVWAVAAGGPELAARVGAALDPRWKEVAALAAPGRPAVPTSSVGRLFDAVAALLGVRRRVSYEGQAAMELEALAAAAPAPVGDYDVGWGPDGLDPGPMFAALAQAALDGADRAGLAAGFHAGLARGAARLAVHLADRHRVGAVALTGGVFQNALFARLVGAEISRAGVEVLVHRQVPPGDGGISVGQAAVAALGR